MEHDFRIIQLNKYFKKKWKIMQRKMGEFSESKNKLRFILHRRRYYNSRENT